MSNKNKSKLIKRLITGAMCLTLGFSINGFASVVSDNDGSAFITKAEFDSLKNNFQSQIDQYNTSIDSKIDGAIAAYLSGVKITTIEQRATLNYSKTGVSMMDNDEPLRYRLGYLWAHGITGDAIFQDLSVSGQTMKGTQNRQINIQGTPAYWSGTNSRPFKKLLVSNLNLSKLIAKWVGFGTDCREQLTLQTSTQIMTGTSGFNPFVASPVNPTMLKNHNAARQFTEYNVNGANFSEVVNNYFFYFFNTYNGRIGVGGLQSQTVTKEKENMCVFSDAECYEFQNEGVVTTCAYVQCVAPTSLNTINKKIYDSGSAIFLDSAEDVDWLNASFNNVKLAVQEVNMISGLNRNWNNDATWASEPSTAGKVFAPPVQGFECKGGFDHWKQIYQSNFDEIANSYHDNEKTYNTILEEPISATETSYHMAITAGFPFLNAKKNEKIHYVITPKETSDLPLYVWMKTEPFDIIKKPQEEDKDKFLKLTGNNGAVWDDTNKVLKIVQPDTEVVFEIPEDEEKYTLWMKWSKVPAGGLSAASGGGDLKLSMHAKVELRDN